MSAAQRIARLDAALQRSGENITIIRQGVGLTTVQCRASVRGLKADDFVGPGLQGDYMVLISPTAITTAGWPTGSATAPVGNTLDVRHPRASDTVIVKGKPRQIKFSDAIYVGGVWVRSNLIVAG